MISLLDMYIESPVHCFTLHFVTLVWTTTGLTAALQKVEDEVTKLM